MIIILYLPLYIHLYIHIHTYLFISNIRECPHPSQQHQSQIESGESQIESVCCVVTVCLLTHRSGPVGVPHQHIRYRALEHVRTRTTFRSCGSQCARTRFLLKECACLPQGTTFSSQLVWAALCGYKCTARGVGKTSSR